jgi:lipopolysaccharide/colanic/teichoic acid biosynthesis glycosyltransferase
MPEINADVDLAKTSDYKRLYDIAALLVAFLLFLPLWILLAVIIPIAIWLGDRGPVFYRQERAGINGQTFTILKFRSMIPNAPIAGPAWTSKNDPRITTVGKVLRRTALDELPELLSILKGDMSFVGPRALDVNEHRELEEKIEAFATRLKVRPGLTGMAQVYDRQDNATDKLAYDLSYIDSMNPILDTKLIILSVINTIGARWDQRTGKGL